MDGLQMTNQPNVGAFGYRYGTSSSWDVGNYVGLRYDWDGKV
jgi:hypothetical protein